ncbi:MAG: tRNA (guanosine(37)-N1)-methyltransferase TrmD [Candidatus Liptonbacteria bacterium RIFCSPLOWO2_01_FULL_56_20]|uniref:tRNA (guanine-N(1)-)-methyltransferase n=1 Tax=Candidatus Liptonbacteria bacterium RIFCSPLOWO2_01_FULL_56_20 TaxID=1798652 RepID=A0A1G2CJH4_9BACT|nr:MAG: tRNA (guanine-N(1)-)-methyltransferase [Parcubacteria group bacterium GW2011_GWB1_56_8]OGY98401.1 MAG: tRNA (guanosine(37)-N1)-methyltransferase TrmD [Candidatus Liptonbacteria bacterium RIFCSPHIGHO2_01_FULL_56_18b]OGZ01535.1 MAG: tRNA (guanosine(37)-N1)-methyltransferase TrmD [Candidatus Liptonbacteria bacterium RIFCSPLOWO2_01_FULL_56_20]
MTFHILTIFLKIFDSYLTESLVKRAREKGILAIRVHDLRDFASGRHKKVDDRPFGGGPGMVLQVGPIYRAVQSLTRARKKRRVILFSTRGKKLDAKTAKRLSAYKELVLICGRYEGVDERVARHIADEEISIGEYVLSGGELPALVLIEAVSRFLPGFLGKRESLEEFKGSYPSWSRPEVFVPKKGEAWAVPKALLSGDHKKIEKWRRQK